MLPSACLGPTDPSMTSPFSPTNGTGNPIPINTEDLASYIQFTKEDFGIKSQDNKLKALELLTKSDNRVHPIVLGAVKRGTKLAKRYAEELLKIHMSDQKEISKIVNTFGSELFAHNHPINRDEAKRLGLNIVNNSKLEETIWELFNIYENQLHMREPFNPVIEFKRMHKEDLPLSMGNSINPIKAEFELPLIIIDSLAQSDLFFQNWQVEGVKFVSNEGLKENFSTLITDQSWKEIKV